MLSQIGYEVAENIEQVIVRKERNTAKRNANVARNYKKLAEETERLRREHGLFGGSNGSTSHVDEEITPNTTNGSDPVKLLMERITSDLERMQTTVTSQSFNSFFVSLCAQFGRIKPETEDIQSGTRDIVWSTMAMLMMMLGMITVTNYAVYPVVAGKRKESPPQSQKSILQLELRRICTGGVQGTSMRDLRSLIKQHGDVLGHIKTVGRGRTKARIIEDIDFAVQNMQ